MHAALRHLGGLIAWAACGAAAVGSPPQEVRGVPRTLVDRSLQEHPVLLLAIDARTITYSDAAGLVRTEPRDEFLAFLPALDPPPPPPGTPEPQAAAPNQPMALELVDGQRLMGSLGAVIRSGASPSETIAWDHAALGSVEVGLEEVRRIQLRADAPIAPPGGAPGDLDVIILFNGDRIEGLVEGLLVSGPAVRLIAGEEPRDIPLERVSEMRVHSNPAKDPPEGAAMIWLRDGSIIAGRELRTNRLGDVALDLALGDQPGAPGAEGTLAAGGSITLGDMVGADLHPGSLVPLAGLAPAEQSPLGQRRWTRSVAALDPAAMLRLSDLELPGPMTAEWDLPAGAARFATTAELPRAMWNWGDCELSVALVSAGGELELFRHRLSADQPRAAINVPLERAGAGARLRIRVDQGNFGPVQDRVVLRRPMLRVDGAR